MRETWYVLEGGGVADPRECAPGEDGRLTHKSGIAVEMRGETPRSRGVDLDPDGNGPSNKAPSGATKTRELTAEKPKRGYKTRDLKAD